MGMNYHQKNLSTPPHQLYWLMKTKYWYSSTVFSVDLPNCYLSPFIQQQSAARGQILYTYHTILWTRKWYAWIIWFCCIFKYFLNYIMFRIVWNERNKWQKEAIWNYKSICVMLSVWHFLIHIVCRCNTVCTEHKVCPRLYDMQRVVKSLTMLHLHNSNQQSSD